MVKLGKIGVIENISMSWMPLWVIDLQQSHLPIVIDTPTTSTSNQEEEEDELDQGKRP